MPNWEAIKTEYITTSISYRKLADKWGVSFRTLGDRAKREDWVDERNRHRNNVVMSTVQKVAARTSSTNANRLLRLQEAADSMGKVIAEIFDDKEQFARHIITEGIGEGVTKVEERLYKKIDTKAIKDLTGAMKDLAYVLRNIYDIPTVQEKSAMDIAAERLQLDKAKVSSGAEGSLETGIVELAPVLVEPEEVETHGG